MTEERRAELLGQVEQMKAELAFIRAQAGRVSAGEMPRGRDGRPVHWMKIWGLSKQIAESHATVSLLAEGRHEVFQRWAEDDDGAPHLECVCGAVVPGDEETLSRAEFLNAPGHTPGNRGLGGLADLSQPDPWLAESWAPAAERGTLGELLTALEEERWTLVHAITVMEEQAQQADAGEWLVGAYRHWSRLNERLSAIRKDKHQPFVHEQGADGRWWVVCSCGVRIEGLLGQTLNDIGFRNGSHYSLRGTPDQDMRPPAPPWMTIEEAKSHLVEAALWAGRIAVFEGTL